MLDHYMGGKTPPKQMDDKIYSLLSFVFQVGVAFNATPTLNKLH